MNDKEISQEQKEVRGGVTGFLEKNRSPLFGGIICVVIICIGFVVAMVVIDEQNKKTIAQLEPYIERFEKILKSKEYTALTETISGSLTDETLEVAENSAESGNAVSDSVTRDTEESIDSFITDIKAFAEKHSGYPAAEAWSITAHLYAQKGEWKDAEGMYLKASETGKKTHIAPTAYFNAAVCAEELGDREAARQHYIESTKFPDFSQGAHAQFSIGRLYEEDRNIQAAIDAYQTVIDKWEKAENWTSLAHSRIIALSLDDK